MSLLDKYLKELTVSDKQNIEITLKCACAVIIKEGDNGENLVLVLRRSPKDHWPLAIDLPRGKCDGGKDKKDYNEKIIDCLKREVKEETGLDIVPIKFIDKFSYIADRGTRETIQYNFLCRMRDPDQKIKLSKEHDKYEWISSIGQLELMLMPEMKKTVSKVFNTDIKIVNYGDNDEQIDITENFKCSGN